MLEDILKNEGYGTQPNSFDSIAINQELAGSDSSATWEGLYDNAVAGLDIPPPYFGIDQTDPTARSAMMTAYAQVMAGTLPGDQLPDIQSVVADSVLPYMSIRPKPNVDGPGILVHICSQCHNSRLDQTLTRARFNPTHLDTMSAEERQRAVDRLQLSANDPAKMPPPRFRTLSEDEQALAIQALTP